MNRYVVAAAAVVFVAIIAVAIAFAVRGGNDTSSAESVPAVSGGESVAPTGSTAATTTSAPPCNAGVFLPVLKERMDREADDYRIVRAKVGLCRNGYAQVFAVPDQSACAAGPCLETEQVFLAWTGSRWRFLTAGTGISCPEGNETAPVVRRACEGLGFPQAPLLTTKRFRMPSGNIGCALSGEVLRCDILSGLEPEPDRACELDWVGIVLPLDGPATPNCAGDTVYDETAPVLVYGAIWVRHHFTCYSARTGLSCIAGGEFMLAREGWTAS